MIGFHGYDMNFMNECMFDAQHCQSALDGLDGTPQHITITRGSLPGEPVGKGKGRGGASAGSRGAGTPSLSNSGGALLASKFDGPKEAKPKVEKNGTDSLGCFSGAVDKDVDTAFLLR